MRRGASWLALASLLAACGTPLEKPEPTSSLRYRVRPPVAFEMLHDDETLPILDLRTRAEFGGGHLARALNLPLAELEDRLSEISDLKQRTLLIYCSAELDCGDVALEILRDNGFRAVLMDGGIEEWVSCGFGTVKHRMDCDDEVSNEDDYVQIAQGVQ